jgi:hypothetical protein
MDPRSSLDTIRQTWRPPKELERSRPREVQLTWSGKILAGVVVALILGGLTAGFVLYGNAYHGRDQHDQLVKSGKDAEATVTRCWSSGHDPVRYWAEYTYNVDGRTYKGRLSTNRNSWVALEGMGTVSVRYLTGDPRTHFVHGFESPLPPLWLSIVVAGALFLEAWLLGRILSGQRRLLTEGRPAPAIVTKISRTQHGKVAHYVFMEMSGALVNGKSRPRRSPPAVGSTLNVIYEPDRERHNGVYPLSLVKPRAY